MRQTDRITGFNTDPLQDRPDLLAPIFEEFEQSENAETVALNDQPAKAEAFYQAERADHHSILDEMVSGVSNQGIAFISGSQLAETPEAKAVDGKATQLEESLSLIRANGTGRQERLVMLGDQRVSACFWRKMEMSGKIRMERGQLALNVSMDNAIRTYKAAAQEIGVDVTGFAKFESARSGWTRILPGVKNHEIHVFGAGTPNEIKKIADDVQQFSDRLLASGVVVASDISHRPGEEMVTYRSNVELQRLLTLADSQVILQREAEQKARDASRSRSASAGGGSKMTSGGAKAAPADRATTPVAGRHADHAIAKELFQLLDQPLVATKLRGGGEWNLAILDRVHELSKQLDAHRLQQSDIPRSVADAIAGGLDGIAASCRRAVSEGAAYKQGLPHDSPIVKYFAAAPQFGTIAISERTPEFKWLSAERSVVRARVGKPLTSDEISNSHSSRSVMGALNSHETGNSHFSQHSSDTVLSARRQDIREIER